MKTFAIALALIAVSAEANYYGYQQSGNPFNSYY